MCDLSHLSRIALTVCCCEQGAGLLLSYQECSECPKAHACWCQGGPRQRLTLPVASCGSWTLPWWQVNAPTISQSNPEFVCPEESRILCVVCTSPQLTLLEARAFAAPDTHALPALHFGNEDQTARIADKVPLHSAPHNLHTHMLAGGWAPLRRRECHLAFMCAHVVHRQTTSETITCAHASC